MVLLKKWPFFQLFFLGNIDQENVFYVILGRKNTFPVYKNKKFKKSKNWHDMVSFQKSPFFELFFFRQYRPGKCLLRYSWTKKCFLGYKNKKFKESKNWHFFKGVKPIVFVQKWPFFQLFFLGNIDLENVFYHILERKYAFLGYKNKKFKMSKNWHFSKGVNPSFWSENDHFSNFFFLGNRDQENVFYDILERKNAFLGYKNKKFKKSKNWHFSKGVNPWFWSKNGHFSNFFFYAI